MRSLFFILVLFFTQSSIFASITSLKKGRGVKKNSNDEIEICWNGVNSPYGESLKKVIEPYVENQLIRAGVKVYFHEKNCLELENPFYPIGLIFFDDPETPEPLINMVEGLARGDLPGHPKTYFDGHWVHDQIVDIVLSSRFKEVSSSLKEQSRGLSREGTDNLHRSIALHEILHALGIAHEHRQENSTCHIEDDVYSMILKPLTGYDENSIMNYCLIHDHDYESGPIGLSEMDLMGLEALYLFH